MSKKEAHESYERVLKDIFYAKQHRFDMKSEGCAALVTALHMLEDKDTEIVRLQRQVKAVVEAANECCEFEMCMTLRDRLEDLGIVR